MTAEDIGFSIEELRLELDSAENALADYQQALEEDEDVWEAGYEDMLIDHIEQLQQEIDYLLSLVPNA